MIFKTIKPRTSSLRHLKLLKKEKEISVNIPLKTKLSFKKVSSGRNNQGRITVRHKGGGVKKLYRHVDFYRINTKGIVEKIEYDPNRTSFIGRLYDYEKGFHSYILASSNLKRGDLIQSGEFAELKEGNSLPLSKIPVGFFIHNISLSRKGKGKLIRSGGTFGQLIQKDEKYVRIKLPSGEQRLILKDNFASIGSISNPNNFCSVLGKAGRSRWCNRRPSVRGVAMNPVDHPHGGGEGKTSGGRPSVTPWGKPTKGQPTSKFKKTRSYILLSYRLKKK